MILDIIMAHKGHLTAEEIYMKAKQIYPSVAVGTVYRNLALLTEADKIRRLIIPNAPDRYDKTTLHHDHFICQKCGSLLDISIADMKEYIERQTGIQILGYDLNLRYVCEQCKKEGVK